MARRGRNGHRAGVYRPTFAVADTSVKRLIGSGRRECIDHLIILDESHLHRIVRNYLAYYYGRRTHLSRYKDAPIGRVLESGEIGNIGALPMLGGLHHRYTRRAA